MSTRGEMLQGLARRIGAVHPGHPLRVAVDGITAAGKSTLAAELTAVLTAVGRTALHLSTDDYHHVAVHRRRDPDRARGYYRDAYDLAAFERLVLRPLGPGGDGRYVARRHDLASDAVLPETFETAAADAVVVVDGSFLQSAGLRPQWDVVVWVDTSFAVAEDRAARRDVHLFGSPDEVRAAYRERYHPACRLYLAEWDPAAHATYLVTNDQLDEPELSAPGH